MLQMLSVPLVVAALAGGCSGGEEDAAFESDRTRPTDVSEHDHSNEDSALAPDTVMAADIAELGKGAAVGEELSVWIGVNVCGRFLEIPAREGSGGLSLDATGGLTVAPQAGDESGHDITVADVMEMLDIQLATSTMSFGERWAPTEVALSPAAEPSPLAGRSFATGDDCGTEQGEVQLWYYTAESVDSGEDVRMVVTDPEDVPLVGDGAAVTVAFAPTSSLPTLPPAVLVG